MKSDANSSEMILKKLTDIIWASPLWMPLSSVSPAFIWIHGLQISKPQVFRPPVFPPVAVLDSSPSNPLFQRVMNMLYIRKTNPSLRRCKLENIIINILWTLTQYHNKQKFEEPKHLRGVRSWWQNSLWASRAVLNEQPTVHRSQSPKWVQACHKALIMIRALVLQRVRREKAWEKSNV